MQARTSHTVSLKEGENVNLVCDADGYPSPNITWVRVSGAVLPNGKLRVAVSKTSFVTYDTPINYIVNSV